MRSFLSTNVVLTLLLLLGSGCGSDAMSTTGATVTGTLTLPAATSGKPYFVRLMTTLGTTFVAEQSGTTTANTTLSYSMAGAAAGTYFVLGFVDVDSSGGTASTTGDYRGWYGHTGDGNPPAAANATVPATGTVTFDFGLVPAP